MSHPDIDVIKKHLRPLKRHLVCFISLRHRAIKLIKIVTLVRTMAM